MVSVRRRIERIGKSLALSGAAMKLNKTVVFINTDGEVKQELRLENGHREWITYGEPKEAAVE